MPLFPGQHPDEKIRLRIHRHWRTEVWPFAKMTLAIGLAGGTASFLFSPEMIEAGAEFSWLLLSILSLLLGVWLFRQLVNLFSEILDGFIITDNRLILVEQEGIFRRSTKEMSLSQIEDIQAESEGKIDTLFRTGTLTIANSSESILFELEHVPKLHHLKSQIMNIREEAIAREKEEERKAAAEEIAAATAEALGGKLPGGGKEEESRAVKDAGRQLARREKVVGATGTARRFEIREIEERPLTPAEERAARTLRKVEVPS